MSEKLNTQEALSALRHLETAGGELLGLDGFRVHPDGSYEAPIDLILDFTAMGAPDIDPVQRFADAREFVTANDAPHVHWEIVSGSLEE